MRVAFAILCLVIATQAAAEPMSAAEMRAAFFGATLQGEYSDGLGWSEEFDDAGRSVYAQGGAQANGRIAFPGSAGRERICFTYPNGFSGGCFEGWRRSVNCFDFYGVDAGGVPYATRRQREGGTGWTARAWRTDAESTCESVPVG